MAPRNSISSYLTRRKDAVMVRMSGASSAALLGVLATFAATPGAAEAAPSHPTEPSSASPSESPASALAGARFFVNSSSSARRQAEQWRKSRPAEAALMEKIASQPIAHWFGDWNREIRRDVDVIVSTAAGMGTVPVLVAYNIPQRDCGLYSKGGAKGEDAYRKWISNFAAGIHNQRAVVIVEPDALAGMECLSPQDQEHRVSMVKFAVQTLKQAGATVYLDAGNANWIDATRMAERLQRASIDQADGFALNVSNFIATGPSVAYGEKLSQKVGGKHFIIDTSRNGAGTAGSGQWCNPQGRALGAAPTTQTGNALVDAFLWIKAPGESDGTCNGGPAAGQWWAEYALSLAQNASQVASR
jgi:endoglucanase